MVPLATGVGSQFVFFRRHSYSPHPRHRSLGRFGTSVLPESTSVGQISLKQDKHETNLGSHPLLDVIR